MTPEDLDAIRAIVREELAAAGRGPRRGKKRGARPKAADDFADVTELDAAAARRLAGRAGFYVRTKR